MTDLGAKRRNGGLGEMTLRSELPIAIAGDRRHGRSRPIGSGGSSGSGHGMVGDGRMRRRTTRSCLRL